MGSNASGGETTLVMIHQTDQVTHSLNAWKHVAGSTIGKSRTRLSFDKSSEWPIVVVALQAVANPQTLNCFLVLFNSVRI